MNFMTRDRSLLKNTACAVVLFIALSASANANVSQDELAVALRSHFIELSEDDRLTIQNRLKNFVGNYQDDIDGLWGQNTQNAVINFFSYSARDLIEDSSNADVLAARILDFIVGWQFEQNYIMTAEFGEEECDNCEPAAATPAQIDIKDPSTEAARAIIEAFETTGPLCIASGFQPQHDVWRDLGGDASIIDFIVDISENFYAGDSAAFRQLVAKSADYGDYPILQYMMGYGHLKNGELENSLRWLTEAARNGESDSAYLLSLIALSYESSSAGSSAQYSDKAIDLHTLVPGGMAQLFASIPTGPMYLDVAVNCLEQVVNTEGEFKIYKGYYKSDYRTSAAKLLAVIYLHILTGVPDEQWKLVERDPQKSLNMLAIARQESEDRRDEAFEQAVETEARRQIEEDRRRELERQEDVRMTMILSATELSEIEGKCDGFVSIKGACWNQSLNERVQVLATKGYSCQASTEPFTGSFEKCTNNGAVIRIFEGKMDFDCRNFNTCGYELREVAELLVKNDVIVKLDYNFRTYGDGVNTFEVHEYCGRGPRGSKLCVTENFGSILISLEIGGSANPTPSFD